MNGNHHSAARPFSASDTLQPASVEEVLQARLTAYALGQLEGEERAMVEAELARSAAARQEVAEIQAWSDRLREANRAVVVAPSPTLRDAVARQLKQLTMTHVAPGAQVAASTSAERSKGRRDWRGWAAMAAAACLMVAAIGLFWGRGDRASEQVAGGGPDARSAAPVPESVATSPSASPSHAPETMTQSSAPVVVQSPLRQAPSPPAPPAAPAVAADSSSQSSQIAGSKGVVPTPMPSAESGPGPTKETSASASDQPQAEAIPSRRSPADLEPRIVPPSTLAHAPSRGARHLAAAKPGFLDVYMSTRPPDLSAPRPTPRPQRSREAGLPGAKFGVGASPSPPEIVSQSDAGREPAPSGFTAKSQPSQTHLALPPGMRPGNDRVPADVRPGLDSTKAGKKGKGPPPEPSLPDEPSSDVAVENDFLPTAQFPYSAFSLAIDPNALALVSRYLHAKHLPRPDQVQIEDLINAFDYEDPQPTGGDLFAVHVEAADCPWAPEHRLVRIAITSCGVPEAGKDRRGGRSDSSPVIADDVRVQVQFNPLVAARYRLIGYDPPPAGANRAEESMLGGASFAAGQTVVAMYQIVPHRQPPPTEPAKGDPRPSKALRGSNRDLTAVEPSTALLTVRLRYQPRGEKPRWLEVPWVDPGQSFDAASGDFRFSAAVAALGMMLRSSPHRGTMTWDDIERIAESSRGNDRRRAELLELIRLARQLGAGR